MWAPMQPAGVKCKVEAVEREDYVGRDLVQTDGEGRPIMAVHTTRDTGVDICVYAPAAQGESETVRALLAELAPLKAEVERLRAKLRGLEP